ncbi:MAG: hypothetical protein M0D55_12855 [Elusimicrobiota bacterium]|nr:MAG: hypothetical protein M0D55_12855 [Elusimicrobiota bacterium]
MSLARTFMSVAVFIAAFCPVGTLALVHAVDSAHVHGHDDGTVHAHEHEAADHHDEDALRHTDDVARIAAPGVTFAPGPRLERPAAEAPASADATLPRPPASAALDPPPLRSTCFVSSSSAGRAPPPNSRLGRSSPPRPETR